MEVCEVQILGDSVPPLTKEFGCSDLFLLRTPVEFEHFIHLVCLLRQVGFLLSCKLVHTVLQVILNLASSGILLLPFLLFGEIACLFRC